MNDVLYILREQKNLTKSKKPQSISEQINRAKPMMTPSQTTAALGRRTTVIRKKVIWIRN